MSDSLSSSTFVVEFKGVVGPLVEALKAATTEIGKFTSTLSSSFKKASADVATDSQKIANSAKTVKKGLEDGTDPKKVKKNLEETSKEIKQLNILLAATRAFKGVQVDPDAFQSLDKLKQAIKTTLDVLAKSANSPEIKAAINQLKFRQNFSEKDGPTAEIKNYFKQVATIAKQAQAENDKTGKLNVASKKEENAEIEALEHALAATIKEVNKQISSSTKAGNAEAAESYKLLKDALKYFSDPSELKKFYEEEHASIQKSITDNKQALATKKANDAEINALNKATAAITKDANKQIAAAIKAGNKEAADSYRLLKDAVRYFSDPVEMKKFYEEEHANLQKSIMDIKEAAAVKKAAEKEAKELLQEKGALEKQISTSIAQYARQGDLVKVQELQRLRQFIQEQQVLDAVQIEGYRNIYNEQIKESTAAKETTAVIESLIKRRQAALISYYAIQKSSIKLGQELEAEAVEQTLARVKVADAEKLRLLEQEFQREKDRLKILAEEQAVTDLKKKTSLDAIIEKYKQLTGAEISTAQAEKIIEAESGTFSQKLQVALSLAISRSNALSTTLHHVGQTLYQVGTSLKVFGAIGLATFTGMVQSSTTLIEHLRRLSEETNLSFENAQRLSGAFAQFGVSETEAERAFKILSETMTKVHDNVPGADIALRKLGITQKDLEANNYSLIDTFKLLIDRLHDQKNGAIAVGEATTELGRNTVAALQVAAGGSKGFTDALSKIDPIAEKQAQAMSILGEKVELFKKQFALLVLEFISTVGPTIESITNKILGLAKAINNLSPFWKATIANTVVWGGVLAVLGGTLLTFTGFLLGIVRLFTEFPIRVAIAKVAMREMGLAAGAAAPEINAAALAQERLNLALKSQNTSSALTAARGAAASGIGIPIAAVLALGVGIGIVAKGLGELHKNWREMVGDAIKHKNSLDAAADANKRFGDSLAQNQQQMLNNKELLHALPYLLEVYSDAIKQTNGDVGQTADYQHKIDIIKALMAETAKLDGTDQQYLETLKQVDDQLKQNGTDLIQQIKSGEVANAQAIEDFRETQATFLASQNLTNIDLTEKTAILNKQVLEAQTELTHQLTLQYNERRNAEKESFSNRIKDVHDVTKAEIEAWADSKDKQITFAKDGSIASKTLSDATIRDRHELVEKLYANNAKREKDSLTDQAKTLQEKIKSGQVANDQEVQNFAAAELKKINKAELSKDQRLALIADLTHKQMTLLDDYNAYELKTTKETIQAEAEARKEAAETAKQQKLASLAVIKTNTEEGFLKEEFKINQDVTAEKISQGEAERRLHDLAIDRINAELAGENQIYAINKKYTDDNIKAQGDIVKAIEGKIADTNAILAKLPKEGGDEEQVRKRTEQQAVLLLQTQELAKAKVEAAKLTTEADQDAATHASTTGKLVRDESQKTLDFQKQLAAEKKKSDSDLLTFEKGLSDDALVKAEDTAEKMIDQFDQLVLARKNYLDKSKADQATYNAEIDKLGKDEIALRQKVAETIAEGAESQFKKVLDTADKYGQLDVSTLQTLADQIQKSIELTIQQQGAEALTNNELLSRVGVLDDIKSKIDEVNNAAKKSTGEFENFFNTFNPGSISNFDKSNQTFKEISSDFFDLNKNADALSGKKLNLGVDIKAATGTALKDLASQFTGSNSVGAASTQLKSNFDSLSQSIAKVKGLLDESSSKVGDLNPSGAKDGDSTQGSKFDTGKSFFNGKKIFTGLYDSINVDPVFHDTAIKNDAGRTKPASSEPKKADTSPKNIVTNNISIDGATSNVTRALHEQYHRTWQDAQSKDLFPDPIFSSMYQAAVPGIR